MVCALDRRDIGKPLNRFVGEDRQRAPFGDPCIVVEPLLRHRLLHHHHTVLLQPMDLVQRLLAVLPALIGIYGQRQVSDFANGADHLLVVVESDLDLQYVEAVGAFPGLLAYHIGSVYTDGEGRIRSFGRVKAPQAPPRLAQKLSHKVMQGYVDCGLRGTVAGRKAVYIGKYVLKLERVIELREIHLAQKGAYGLDALAQIRRHRCLAISCKSLILKLYLYVRRSLARI